MKWLLTTMNYRTDKKIKIIFKETIARKCSN